MHVRFRAGIVSFCVRYFLNRLYLLKILVHTPRGDLNNPRTMIKWCVHEVVKYCASGFPYILVFTFSFRPVE